MLPPRSPAGGLQTGQGVVAAGPALSRCGDFSFPCSFGSPVGCKNPTACIPPGLGERGQGRRMPAGMGQVLQGNCLNRLVGRELGCRLLLLENQMGLDSVLTLILM